MESILHGDFFHQHDHHHHHDNHEQHDNLLHPPKITLRTMSRSDPHLEIPHLLVSQDEAHPSLNKMMANFQNVHEGLKTPVSSHINLQALRHENEYQNRSSAALLSQETLSQPPLRKSSSAIDWNGAVVEATRKASRQTDWQSLLFENNRKTSFSNFSHFAQPAPPAPHNHQSVVPSSEFAKQGGLVMNTSEKQGMSATAVATQMPSQQNHFSQAIIASSSNVVNQSNGPSAPSATSAPIQANLADSRPDRSAGGGVFGMFNRGFFSKPVERSEEENYRYLMALDR